MNSADQIEARLQQLEAERSLILDQVDDAIALFDADWHLILFNQSLVQIWQLPGEWLAQKPTLEEIIDWVVQQGHWTTEQRAEFFSTFVSDRSTGSGAYFVSQTDGTCLEVHATRTSDGGWLFNFRDLTQQQQVQNKLSAEVRRLTFLLGLTERLQTSNNLIEVGQFSLNYLVQAMGASFGDVKVIQGDGRERWAGPLTNVVSGQFIATHGEPAVATMQETLNQGIPYGQGLLWDVVATGKPAFVEDYANHPKAVPAFRHPAIGQLGIFPIPSADGTIIGVLTLESRTVQKLQEAPQQDMLLAACRTLGAAIERAQSQHRLKQINQDLERASRLKSEFLASMSHELRTPLNSILGFSELLLRQPDTLDDRKTKHIGAIRQSGEHLLQLINDILDLSKIEAGKVDLDLETVSIPDLCRQCLDMIRPRTERKRIALALELDYRLDQVPLDKRRVRQMIVNLLSNAVKFTPERGQIKLTANLSYGTQLMLEQRPDDSPINHSTPYLCIEVQDNGIGIPQEKQSLLFQPFQQIDASLTRRHDGTGLGLALTKRLAELHGGTVSFSSTEGKGSRFCIWIPLHEIRAQLRPLNHSSEPDPANALDLSASFLTQDYQETSQQRILIVEDQPFNQTLISEFLEMEGYLVELIDDGQIMLQTLQSKLVTPRSLPDLVLMDIQLPGVDGFDLIRRLRHSQIWHSVPVIAVTAMAMAGDRDRCLEAGANDYVSKPLDLKGLLNKVRALIQTDDISAPANPGDELSSQPESEGAASDDVG
ncbi:MAG: ATP-binding protein [Thainema sp.]